MANSPNLALPYIDQNQSQKHVTHNAAIRALDALVQLSVLSDSLTAPPGSPADGDRYIVASGATGAWAGKDLNVAAWQDGAWIFYPPKAGWLAFVASRSEAHLWTGSAWAPLASVIGALANLAGLGILTTADTTNRLAVKSDAALFSHNDVTPGTGDMRIAVNKSAAGKDAGFTLQDAFSTRAIFGLLGDDNFTIKVSPDGASFHQGVSVDKSTGHVGLNGFTADANNGLGVKGTAFLFDAETDHCRLTFNKSAAANDASLTFQSGYSARALIGLLGNDDFTFKVSADGSAFFNAFRVFNFCGRVDNRDSARRRYMEWIPNVNTTTLNANGLTTIVTGTATAAALSSTSMFTQSPRIIFASSSIAGSSAGVNGAQNAVWRGSASDRGGFFLLMRFGWEVAQAQGRCFAGLMSSLTAIGNVNPSTLTNIIGVGFDSAQTTLRLLTNDGAGAATATDLGANFPSNSAQEFYELMLSAEPGGSTVSYRVERLNTGHIAVGAISTDLPAASTFLTPHLWGNNGTTAAAVQIALHTMYLENASLYGSRGF
jgi:hypothetical protein